MRLELIFFLQTNWKNYKNIFSSKKLFFEKRGFLELHRGNLKIWGKILIPFLSELWRSFKIIFFNFFRRNLCLLEINTFLKDLQKLFWVNSPIKVSKEIRSWNLFACFCIERNLPGNSQMKELWSFFFKVVVWVLHVRYLVTEFGIVVFLKFLWN